MEDYLSKTLVDAGKEILKNQLHVYAEAEDEEMIHVISEMINDDNACYDIVRRLILKVSENDDIVFESLSLTMNDFVTKKNMEDPEELQYFKDVQKVCKMVDEFSKMPNNNTGSKEFENISNFCEEHDIPLNISLLPNEGYPPKEKPYRLIVDDFYIWDLVEREKTYD